ncbi:MAG: hypothetical protein HW408_1433 [Actinobacteria bacterium]|nr:hypothetical protein [Actinomycetota bacterium]
MDRFFGLLQNAIGTDRFGDVLDAVLSQGFIFRFHPALHLEIGASGNADAPRTRQPLQSGGGLDAIAQDLPFFLRHFPEMNPDPERDSAS